MQAQTILNSNVLIYIRTVAHIGLLKVLATVLFIHAIIHYMNISTAILKMPRSSRAIKTISSYTTRDTSVTFIIH